MEQTLTPSQVLAPEMEAYERRTGRVDGLDVIRDTLATYGATRFRELEGMRAVQCVADILKIFREGS